MFYSNFSDRLRISKKTIPFSKKQKKNINYSNLKQEQSKLSIRCKHLTKMRLTFIQTEIFYIAK